MWCCDGGNNASVLCKFIRDTIKIRIVGINILEGEGISWAEPGEMFVEQKSLHLILLERERFITSQKLNPFSIQSKSLGKCTCMYHLNTLTIRQ